MKYFLSIGSNIEPEKNIDFALEQLDLILDSFLILAWLTIQIISSTRESDRYGDLMSSSSLLESSFKFRFVFLYFSRQRLNFSTSILKFFLLRYQNPIIFSYFIEYI